MTDPPATFRFPNSELRWAAVAALGVVMIASLPYLVVALTTPANLRFGGALVTPIDAQSYFAKMRQGYDGLWLFRLPFTAGGEPEAFLFTFHLALGHLARLLGLSLVAVYHLARILGGWMLLVAAYLFITRVFDRVSERRWAWAFVALTSGLGWLGVAASDVTIPESNTFFSLMTNAHFSASMALMLIVFMAVIDASKRAWLCAALASLGLAILQPFAPIAVFVAIGVGWLLGGWLRGERWRATLPGQVKTAVLAGLSITPLMIYFYLATQRDPILQGWSAQNQTPSPPPLEYLMGYGLLGLLAIPGVCSALKRKRNIDVLLVAWLISSAVLLYAPFPLQRRFSLGLHIPIAILGVMGIFTLTAKFASQVWRRWLPRIVLLVSLPTTALLLLITSTAALRPPDGRLFFSADEAAAFDWLREHAPHTALVMAAPQTGLFLPAWADVRVVYGHPFETLDAQRMKTLAEQFFAGSLDRDRVLRDYPVDYIFFGPREKTLGRPDTAWSPAYVAGAVTIYHAP